MGLLDEIGGFFFGWLAPEAPEPLPPGTELTSAQTDAHVGVVIGKVYKATGNIIFKETNDGDTDDINNDLLHIIVVWAESVQSIDEVYVDDIPVSSDNPAFFHDDGGRVVHMRNFPNGMDNYEDSLLSAAGWRSSDTASGKACTYIRLEYHGGEFAISSEPKITADLTGTSHSNPALGTFDYLKNSLYGKGLPSRLVNASSFYSGRDLSQSLVDEVDGQPQKRPLFSCNCKLDTSKNILENVNILLRPMRGWLPIIDGQLTLIIEQDDDPVAIPILERDIIEMDGVSEGSKNKRYNRVATTYYEPAADGTAQEAVYPPKGSALEAQLLEEDNGFINEGTVDLVTCNNYYEALEFAKTWLEISREQTKTRIHLPKWALIYDVGDIVPVYESYLGWDGKLFRIESISSNKEKVTLTVREHQPYIYDFFGGGNKPEIPDTVYRLTNPDEPSNLSIEHIYSSFVQVKVTWESDASRFLYQVLDGQGLLLETDSIARYHVNIAGYALGTYRFRVMALGGSLSRSGWAEIPLIMEKPGVPTDITINPTATELEVIPYLAGSDSSTAFLYSISHDLTDEEPPLPYRGPAHAYTFPGLAPERDYKVWICSSNALGESQWTFIVAKTATVDEFWGNIVRTVEIPGLPDNLGNTISGVINDIENWSGQTGDLGEDYSTLVYNVTQVEAANQVNSLNILAVQQKVGSSSVSAQIAEFKNAQIGYEDESGEWIEGAAFAQAFNQIKINTLDGDELSVFSYFQALEDAIGNVQGEIQFAIDANGRMTGLFIRGSEEVSQIIFLATETLWVNAAGDVLLGINTQTGELEFHGSGTFSGTLSSPKFEMIGTNFMKIELADGFGPDSLWFWYGQKIVDNDNKPILSELKKSNAIEWKSIDGDSYFGGTLSAGVLTNSARSTVLTENPSVTVGPFTTNGNSKVVAFSFSYAGSSVYAGQCPSQAQDPSCTVQLQRKVGQGSWQTVQTHQVTGQVTQFYEPDFGGCTTNEEMRGSWTYTDANSTTGVFTYRVVVSSTVRYHGVHDVDYQTVSLISTEE
ncbi:hypothetical protein [Alteromonas sp. P256]|uniref:hypothetical protein n=1 Tax=Alteromonas sp. P256 TaxID=3117399 RepID=UPI002FE249CF